MQVEDRPNEPEFNQGLNQIRSHEDQDLFSLGYSHAAHGRLHEAQITLLAALERGEDNAQAWAVLAAILLCQGSETDAEKAGKAALERCPDLKMTWPRMRSIILADGIRRGDSWKSARAVVFGSETTQWDELLRNLGGGHSGPVPSVASVFKLEAVTEERRDHKGSDELHPESGEETLSIAEASPSFEQRAKTGILTGGSLLDADPAAARLENVNSGGPWFDLANLYVRKKQDAKAEEAYIRGLALSPRNAEAWLRLGNLLLKRGALSEAEDAFRNSTENGSRNHQAWIQLATCQQATGKWEESFHTAKQALELAPQATAAWLCLGKAEFHTNNHRDATKSLLRVVREEPENVEALFYLAKSMQKRGNVKHASTIYKRLLSMRVESIDMMDDLAATFYRLGMEQEAVIARRKANELRRAQTSSP
jgi:tetratricopeptide (TPR) repeat protein